MIFSENINLLAEELESLRKFYPNNFVFQKRNNCLIGKLGFHRPYKGRYIEDWYQLQIIFPENYSKNPPVVKEIGCKIQRDIDHHVNPDDTLCLGPPIEILARFKGDSSLFGFIDTILIPYLYWHSHVRKYGEEPWKAYRHSDEGIKDYRDSVNLKERYFSIFETNNLEAVLNFLEMIVKNAHNNNPKCPCMSGKKLADCHLMQLQTILAMPYLKVSHLAQDYWHLKNKYKKRRR